jgi:multiple sugar transport system permease protein
MQTEYRNKTAGWFRINKLSLAPLVFLIPAFMFFSVYVIIPIFQSLQLSLFEWNGLYNAEGKSTAQYIGLENYRKLWVDPNFWISIKNNFLWLFLYMLAVPLGLFIAIFLNQTVTGHSILQINVLLSICHQSSRGWFDFWVVLQP